MSNTILLTSERGDIRYAKSLTYDGNALADRTGVAWVARDIDWPDRRDYPRWHVPHGHERPDRTYVGGTVITNEGAVTYPGPLSDEQLAAVIDAGALAMTDVAPERYDDDRVIHPVFLDWTGA